MFQMMLVSSNSEKSFHARWETFSGMIIKVLESNFFSISRSRDFGQIEIDCVVIREVNE